MWFWAEANRHFDNSQLISKIAMAAEGSFKVITTKYLQDTKNTADSRSLKEVISRLDAEFSKPAQEKQIKKINDLVNFTRRSTEDIRSFWIRYEQVKNSLILNKIELPETLLYNRALTALKLSSSNRSMVISTLEGRREEGSLKALKEITVKISGFTDINGSARRRME